jgi:hypothetical protein
VATVAARRISGNHASALSVMIADPRFERVDFRLARVTSFDVTGKWPPLHASTTLDTSGAP